MENMLLIKFRQKKGVTNCTVAWNSIVTSMGGATGGMRQTCPPIQNSKRDVPQEIAVVKENFQNFLLKFLDFPIIFKMTWAKYEEKSELGVGGFDSAESIPPS